MSDCNVYPQGNVHTKHTEIQFHLFFCFYFIVIFSVIKPFFFGKRKLFSFFRKRLKSTTYLRTFSTKAENIKMSFFDGS